LSIPPSVLDAILLPGPDPRLAYRNRDILEIPILIKHTPERLYTSKLCFPRFIKRLKAIKFSGVHVIMMHVRGGGLQEVFRPIGICLTDERIEES
jgi:hypothetical protein